MGVVGNQPVRDGHDDIGGFIGLVKHLSAEHKLPVADILRVIEVHERRRANSLARDDGDFRDEHAAGVCERLDDLVRAVEGLVAGGR